MRGHEFVAVIDAGFSNPERSGFAARSADGPSRATERAYWAY